MQAYLLARHDGPGRTTRTAAAAADCLVGRQAGERRGSVEGTSGVRRGKIARRGWPARRADLLPESIEPAVVPEVLTAAGVSASLGAHARGW